MDQEREHVLFQKVRAIVKQKIGHIVSPDIIMNALLDEKQHATEIALLAMRSGMISMTYDVALDLSISLVDLLEQAKISAGQKSIIESSDVWPLERGNGIATRTMVAVPFGIRAPSDEVIAYMTRHYIQPGTAQELIAFAAHPEFKKLKPRVVALGTIIMPTQGYRYVMCINNAPDGWYNHVYTNYYSTEWEEDTLFLGRKLECNIR